MTQFTQQLVNGVVLGALYGLIALGYTMVYGIIQLINFAHGEVFMVGGMGGLAFWNYFLKSHHPPAAISLVLVLLAAMVVAVVVAVIMERLAYRPLRDAPRLAPLITAIGVSLMLREMVRLWYPAGPGAKGFGATVDQVYPEFIRGKNWHFAGVSVERVSVFIFVVAVVLMVALSMFVRRTRTGKAMQATAQDRDTAKLMGIDTDRVIVVAFVLGAALAGIAGVMQGLKIGTLGFSVGFTAGIKAFTAAVLGGIGNIAGAVLGGFLIGIVETMTIQYVPNGGAWKDVGAFVVLIVVLVFRPAGLLGERVVSRA